MIDTTLLAMVIGSAVILLTLLWRERRRDRRADRHDEILSNIENEIAGIKAEMNLLNERADRKVTRSELESRVEEAVGDG